MNTINREMFPLLKPYPEKVLQFGDGNFLRAFADWAIHKMNKEAGFNAGVVAVGPRRNDNIYKLNAQDGLYTLFTNGIEEGKLKRETTVVDCITRGFHTHRDYGAYLQTAENPEMRFIISNTTEAGIEYVPSDRLEDRPQSSFPGKLTAWLYHRYSFFQGDEGKGMLVLPCELIEDNGGKLKEIVLQHAKNWELGAGFEIWIEKANVFYNTLVDRIVPGYPKERELELWEELGYRDLFMVESEWFHLWVIEGTGEIETEFPAAKASLNVVFTKDLTKYRDTKVRILNGAHTSMVPVSYLSGLDTVRETALDETIGKYLEEVIFEKIIPTLDLPQSELERFARDTLDRFKNPFIKHMLISISLNSMSKFKTRVLPTLLEYTEEKGRLPGKLVLSLAALIYFYRGERGEEKIELVDDEDILEIYRKLWKAYDEVELGFEEIAQRILGLEEHWDMDLNKIEGLKERVAHYLAKIEKHGMKNVVLEMIK